MIPEWLDAHGRLFNPNPRVRMMPLRSARPCVVLDDVLANPDGVVAWAAAHRHEFAPPPGNFYPGVVLDLPEDVTRLAMDVLAVHARTRLGARRTQGASLRFSMVTKRPEDLDPCQWQCHCDRIGADATRMDIASVLYLFRDPSLGGTSFYRPLRPDAQINRLLDDSLQLGREAFLQRYDVQPGYMDGSNAYFERIGQAAAAWNRMIFYDGGMFHSGDVGGPQALYPDPRRGRLTLNGFFTCTTAAR